MRIEWVAACVVLAGCQALVGIESTTEVGTDSPDAAVDPGSFSLAVDPASFRVIRGAVVSVPVQITREGGFDGDITVQAGDLPTGVTSAAVVGGLGEAEVTVDLTAVDTAALGDATIQITGTAGELSDAAQASLRVADPPGTLDATFNGGGIRIHENTAPGSALVSVNATGDVVVAHEMPGASNSDWLFAQLADDGSVLATGMQLDLERLNAISVQDSGRVVAGGRFIDVDTPALATIRMTATLTSDITFGGDGRANVGGSVAEALDTAVAPGNGRVVVAGQASSDALLLVIASDGELDATFGGDGRLGFGDFPADLAAFRGVAITGDGGIVMTGESFLPLDLHVMRVDAAGAMDTSFDTDGLVTVASTAADERGDAIAVDAMNRTIVAGRSGGSYLLARLDASGAPDASFGTDGLVIGTVEGLTSRPTAVHVQADGKILVAGTATTSGVSVGFVLRFLDDGTPDASFSGDGVATLGQVTAGGLQVAFASMAVLPDGRITLGGRIDGAGNPGDNGAAVFRLWD